MSQPYFAVGEEVILVSKSHPECNGEHTVARIFIQGDEYKSTSGKPWQNTSDTIGYWLESDDIERRNNGKLWSQSALRKKHPPSTESFTELMSNITKELIE
jgi:hypothetical protein